MALSLDPHETALPPGAAAVTLAGARLAALPSGALWWPQARVLVAGDLHLGRAERTARTGSGFLPPYADADTLDRLAAEIHRCAPATVICLGDSFDDRAAARRVPEATAGRLADLAAGRDWIWIAGNHDPEAPNLPGRWRNEAAIDSLVFRHEAAAGTVPGEVSGHFHPKARLRHKGRAIARRCFLWGAGRLILPAFGTYTGGLDVGDPVFDALVGAGATAALIGSRVTPLPRAALA